MTASLVMTTDAVAPRDRAPAWREWIWKHFGGLESDLYGATDFEGSMASSRAGEVILTRLEASRHRVLRTPQMARGSEGAYLKIVAPWEGSAAVRQQDRQACARAGGWVIYDTTGAYEIDNPEHSDHLIVMLPKAQLAERGLRLDTLMARHVGGATGISRVALETMRNTYQELPHMSPEAAHGAGRLIIELVRLSLLEAGGQPSGMSQREALKDRIRDHVAQHLRDPHLSIDGIAQALNCSRRHLYNAFAGDEDTLAGYIQRQRLGACMRALGQSGDARAITEIALSWGFNNPAHFSRVFREFTGQSPSAYRQQKV